MINNLDKYLHKSYFYLTLKDSLVEVCNAPTDKSGIYIVSAITDNIEEIIYIGSSGKVQQDGTLKTRKAGFGGLKDRIVNGNQFGKIPRRISWHAEMERQGFNILVVRWWVTFNEKYKNIPACVEGNLIQEYFDKYGRLPAWNNEF